MQKGPHVISMEQDADMIRRARKEEAAQIAELFMLAWPVEEILESNGIPYEQLHESMTAIAAAEETIYSYENTFVAEGPVDRPAGYLVRSALLINKNKARSESVFRPGPDSISDAATMTSGSQEYQSFHINIKMKVGGKRRFPPARF